MEVRIKAIASEELAKEVNKDLKVPDPLPEVVEKIFAKNNNEQKEHDKRTVDDSQQDSGQASQ